MSEKLIIRNFGPITNVDLDLRKVNVLIGDQGTGKSTVAKVLDMIKNCFNSVIIELAKSKINNEKQFNNKEKNDFYETLFLLNLSPYFLKNYLNEKSYIFFESPSFKVELNGNKIDFQDKISLDNETNKLFIDFNIFIPAFRESYVLLRDSYPAILNAKAKLPHILNSFGQDFNNFRAEIKKFDFIDLINVTYEYRNGNDLIILKDGKIISFEESSSAVNSVVPMLVVFLGVVADMSNKNKRKLHTRIIHSNNRLITIEEPELNCYPTTQKKLVEFLVEKMKHEDYLKSNEYYCNLLLTTHSPYILTSLNNLMYAYNVGEEHFEETDKIIPSKNWLNPNDVSVYKLVDGESVSIIDQELKQIKVEEIDEISELLSNQWHKMAALNLVKH